MTVGGPPPSSRVAPHLPSPPLPHLLAGNFRPALPEPQGVVEIKGSEPPWGERKREGNVKRKRNVGKGKQPVTRRQGSTAPRKALAAPLLVDSLGRMQRVLLLSGSWSARSIEAGGLGPLRGTT